MLVKFNLHSHPSGFASDAIEIQFLPKRYNNNRFIDFRYQADMPAILNQSILFILDY